MIDTQSRAARRPRKTVTAVTVLALILTVLAGVSAVKSLGIAFPSLFIDPYGSFSAVHLPSWEVEKHGLRHPDRLVSINDIKIGETLKYDDLPIARFYRIVNTLAEQGGSTAQIRFSRSSQFNDFEAEIRRIGLYEIGAFFLIYGLAAWLLFWSGLFVFYFATSHVGAMAYAFTTLCSFLLFLTFFDYHTQSNLIPFFLAGKIGQIIGITWLAFTFPQPPLKYRRPTFIGLTVLSLAGVFSLVLQLAEPIFGNDTQSLRAVINDAFPASLVLLGLSVFIHLIFSKGIIRKQLFSTVVGFLFVPIFVGVSFVVNRYLGGPAFHVLLPLALLMITYTIGYSMIRYNILDMGIVLDRRVFLVPVFLISLFIGVSVFLMACSLAEHPEASRWFPVIIAVIACLLMVFLGFRMVSRLLFPAAAEFRPTVESLAERLSIQSGIKTIQTELITLVRRWLPATSVAVLSETELADTCAMNQEKMENLAIGNPFWITMDQGERHLVQPMRSSGYLQGVLLLAPKAYKALYTEEDLSLLATIAGLGAIALHNARMLEEMEELRKLEAEANNRDKKLSLEVLGAEIAHEINYPLNFFRFLLDELRETGNIESQDIAIGQEEVDRLERMLTGLRKLKFAPPQTKQVALKPTVDRAITLLRDQIASKRIEVASKVPQNLVIEADTDPLLQLFANLLRNAVQVLPECGTIEIRYFNYGQHAVLEVRDNGPGIPEEIAGDIFNPWATTKSEGTGLGLTVCQRIARSFGWSIGMRRENDQTCFYVELPSSNVIQT